MEGWLTDLIDCNLFSSQPFLALFYMTQQDILLDKMFWAKLSKKSERERERGREGRREGACKVLEDLEAFLCRKTNKGRYQETKY